MDPNDSDEQVKPKSLKLSEADFDEDGLISIEDFEEIEAQKLEQNSKPVWKNHVKTSKTVK